jgi:hypothetical protein
MKAVFVEKETTPKKMRFAQSAKFAQFEAAARRALRCDPRGVGLGATTAAGGKANAAGESGTGKDGRWAF